jgi:hypothetical protein
MVLLLWEEISGKLLFDLLSAVLLLILDFPLLLFFVRLQLGTIHHHNKEKLGFSDSKNFTQIHVSFICKKVSFFLFWCPFLIDFFSSRRKDLLLMNKYYVKFLHLLDKLLMLQLKNILVIL